MKRDTLPTLEEIKALIERRPRNVELIQIARAAGATEAWLHQVIGGNTKDPGYEKMRRVYEFLTMKQKRIIDR